MIMVIYTEYHITVGEKLHGQMNESMMAVVWTLREHKVKKVCEPESCYFQGLLVNVIYEIKASAHPESCTKKLP